MIIGIDAVARRTNPNAAFTMIEQNSQMSTTAPAGRHKALRHIAHRASAIADAIERRASASRARRYLASAITVAAVTLALLPVRDALDILDIALVFLLTIFILALVAGSGPAAVAAGSSFLAFNFFFIEPVHTFSVDDVDHVLSLVVYLGVAIVTGQLVARVRARTGAAERERRRTTLLYELNAALIGGVDLDSILSTIVRRVVEIYGAGSSRILLPDRNGDLLVRSRYPYEGASAINRHDLALAAWAMEYREPVGTQARRSKLRWPHGVFGVPPQEPHRVDVLYLPITTPERSVGVLEVVRREDSHRFGADDRDLLSTFANQAALALERARLAESELRAAALSQSEEIKSALLAAVSHDLRTPLATIKTSATALLDTTVEWSSEDRSEFLEAIDEETDRLTRLVDNLLDLSRIEGGALKPYKDWHDVSDLVEDTTSRLSAIARQQQVVGRMEGHPTLAYFDYDQLSRVLMNLGENAIKYSSPGTLITIVARFIDDTFEFSVDDQGPGIPPDFLPHMFEKFTRADANKRVPGSGLGLAISKGLVEAHGGTIWAEAETGRGTTIRFRLPVGADAKVTR
jgi:two-component system sensor histidine kinase KdpD